MDLGDAHRQGWKYKLKKKHERNFSNKSLKRCRKQLGNKTNANETTTALFVPPSVDGLLTQMVSDTEELLRCETGWNMKIIEGSGTPLVQLLRNSFEMKQGCVLGSDCMLCDNSGVGCTTKNVVYMAECSWCKILIKTQVMVII